MSWSQKLRASIIAESYKPLVAENCSVLDIGCGNGVVSEYLANKLGVRLIGTDVRDYRKTKIPFEKMGDYGKLPFVDKKFDYAFLNDVLHHCENVNCTVSEAVRVAKKVLVFEDKETLFLNIIDVILNSLYYPGMKKKPNFKSSAQWADVFQKLNLSPREIAIYSPFYYPIKHVAFVIEERDK